MAWMGSHHKNPKQKISSGFRAGASAFFRSRAMSEDPGGSTPPVKDIYHKTHKAVGPSPSDSGHWMSVHPAAVGKAVSKKDASRHHSASPAVTPTSPAYPAVFARQQTFSESSRTVPGLFAPSAVLDETEFMSSSDDNTSQGAISNSLGGGGSHPRIMVEAPGTDGSPLLPTLGTLGTPGGPPHSSISGPSSPNCAGSPTSPTFRSHIIPPPPTSVSGKSEDWLDVEPSTSAEDVVHGSGLGGPGQSGGKMLLVRKRPSARRKTGSFRKALARSPTTSFRGDPRLVADLSHLTKDHSKYWTDNTQPGDHIWIEAGPSGECYFKEPQCSKMGDKRKCSACHVVAHSGCLPILAKTNFKCKPTYREAVSKFQKDQVLPVRHHWVHKRRQEGRCSGCGRSFQQWRFQARELVAIACSWCKEAYHNKSGCFTMKLVEESCTLGPLSDIVIPPTWMLKIPKKVSTIRKRISTGSTKKKRRSKKDRLFTVRSPPNSGQMPFPRYPLLVFVNPKSGGKAGVNILHKLWWHMNPRQVFDITALNGPKIGLEMFRRVSQLRVLVCGGDGTVGWVLSTLDSLKWPAYPPIGILPLGTGNDLANTLGWGRTYANDPLSNFLTSFCHCDPPQAVVTQLDRWRIEITPNNVAQAQEDSEAQSEAGDTVSELPLQVMNNYFSLGADAQVALEFHQLRAANPKMFNSQFKNRLFYGGYGTKDFFKRSCRNLAEQLTLECDGVNLTPKIQDLKLHCLLFLNIPRYAGGTNPWGSGSNSPGSSGLFHPPSYSDGKIEVLGFTSTGLAALQMGGHGERLAQCSIVRLITRKPIPVQVDGEPCRLAPSKMTIRLHNQVPVLQRINSKLSNRRGTSSTSTVSITTDPASFSAHAAGVGPSMLFTQLPVGRVSMAVYEQYRYEPDKLLACATTICSITVESEADLDQAREQIKKWIAAERKPQLQHSLTTPIKLTSPPAISVRSSASSASLSSNWCFLDYMHDRVFRVEPTTEHVQEVADVCNTSKMLLLLDCRQEDTSGESAPGLAGVAPGERKASHQPQEHRTFEQATGGLMTLSPEGLMTSPSPSPSGGESDGVFRPEEMLARQRARRGEGHQENIAEQEAEQEWEEDDDENDHEVLARARNRLSSQDLDMIASNMNFDYFHQDDVIL